VKVSRTRTRGTVLVDPFRRTPVAHHRDLLHRRRLRRGTLAVALLILGVGRLRGRGAA
jgi:hypothetical protein